MIFGNETSSMNLYGNSFKGVKVALFLGNELDVVACTGDWLSRKIGYDSTRGNMFLLFSE